MESIINTISSIENYIIIGLIIINIIFLILIVVLFNSLNRVEKKYRRFMRGVSNKNLEELINSYLNKVDEVKEISESIKVLYDDMDVRLKGCIQKVSAIRYKAFDDVGSDLSFSIALLDYYNNGIVLTGLYGRNESIAYAKPIDKGISRYDLSDEEQHVLNEATKK